MRHLFHKFSRPRGPELGVDASASDASVLSSAAMRGELDLERERCRHTGSPCCLLTITAERGSGFGGRGGPIARRLAERVRVSDLVGWGGPDRLCVMLTDTDAEAGRRVAEELAELLADEATPIAIALQPSDERESTGGDSSIDRLGSDGAPRRPTRTR